MIRSLILFDDLAFIARFFGKSLTQDELAAAAHRISIGSPSVVVWGGPFDPPDDGELRELGRQAGVYIFGSLCAADIRGLMPWAEGSADTIAHEARESLVESGAVDSLVLSAIDTVAHRFIPRLLVRVCDRNPQTWTDPDGVTWLVKRVAGPSSPLICVSTSGACLVQDEGATDWYGAASASDPAVDAAIKEALAAVQLAAASPSPAASPQVRAIVDDRYGLARIGEHAALRTIGFDVAERSRGLRPCSEEDEELTRFAARRVADLSLDVVLAMAVEHFKKQLTNGDAPCP